MSSDPPPPDNPPPSAAVPPGPQQPEGAAPPPLPSDGLAPSSVPSPPPPEAFQALNLVVPLLNMGPAHACWNGGTTWFEFATAIATAIGDGLISFYNLPADQFTNLTNLPSYSQVNIPLRDALGSANGRCFAQNPEYQEDLNNHIQSQFTKIKHSLMPAISAKVDDWREKREKELMAKASEEAVVFASLRKTGASPPCSRPKKRGNAQGNAPSSPTPRRDHSTLGKRNLSESSDQGSDTEMSDSEPPSATGPTDVSRTPRAKRVARNRSPSIQPPPTAPSVPVLSSDPGIQRILAFLDQRFLPLEQCLNAIEKRSNPTGLLPQLPESGTRPPPRPTQAPVRPPTSQPPQAPFIAVPQRKKGKQQASYANAAATPAPAQPPSKPNTPPNPRKQDKPKSTEITVQRPPLPAEPKESRTPADKIVARVQLSLREAKSDIPLVFGCWAAHTNNFVYVFSGDLPFSRIQQVSKLLLAPFTGGVLAPVGGWSRVLLNGIPTHDPTDPESVVHTEEELEAALRLNPIFKKIQFVMPPRWLIRPEEIVSDYASLTFSIHDPDGSLTKCILQTPIGVFGARALARCFESCPPLRQCARCHRLGHTANDSSCKIKRDTARCYLCGGAHNASDHPTNCRRASRHREHGICDCTTKCINCQREGHHALDISCPDCARFRIPGRYAAPPNAEPINADPNPPVLNV